MLPWSALTANRVERPVVGDLTETAKNVGKNCGRGGVVRLRLGLKNRLPESEANAFDRSKIDKRIVAATVFGSHSERSPTMKGFSRRFAQTKSSE